MSLIIGGCGCGHDVCLCPSYVVLMYLPTNLNGWGRLRVWSGHIEVGVVWS